MSGGNKDLLAIRNNMRQKRAGRRAGGAFAPVLEAPTEESTTPDEGLGDSPGNSPPNVPASSDVKTAPGWQEAREAHQERLLNEKKERGRKIARKDQVARYNEADKKSATGSETSRSETSRSETRVSFGGAEVKEFKPGSSLESGTLPALEAPIKGAMAGSRKKHETAIGAASESLAGEAISEALEELTSEQGSLPGPSITAASAGAVKSGSKGKTP